MSVDRDEWLAVIVLSKVCFLAQLVARKALKCNVCNPHFGHDPMLRVVLRSFPSKKMACTLPEFV